MTWFHRKINIKSDLLELFLAQNQTCARLTRSRSSSRSRQRQTAAAPSPAPTLATEFAWPHLLRPPSPALAATTQTASPSHPLHSFPVLRRRRPLPSSALLCTAVEEEGSSPQRDPGSRSSVVAACSLASARRPTTSLSSRSWDAPGLAVTGSAHARSPTAETKERRSAAMSSAAPGRHNASARDGGRAFSAWAPAATQHSIQETER